MPPEKPPAVAEHQRFKEKIVAINPNLKLAETVDEAIQKSQLNEGVALEKMVQNDPEVVKEWYDSFFRDLQEASKNQLAGVAKLETLENRITQVIDNKLRELANRHLGSMASEIKNPTDTEKKMGEELRPLYANVRHYMAFFASLGMNQNSAIIKQMDQLCSEEKNPTPEQLRQIQNFQMLTLMIGNAQSLNILLELLKSAEFPKINQLAHSKKTRMQQMIKQILKNPLDSDALKANLPILQAETNAIQKELQKILNEELKKQTKGSEPNETLANVKLIIEIAATIIIPYYSTVSQLITVYDGMIRTGQIDQEKLDNLNKAFLLDTAFLLPVTKLFGATARVGTMALSKGAAKMNRAALEMTLQEIAKAGEELNKLAHNNRLYTPGNVLGTGTLVHLSAEEIREKIKELRQIENEEDLEHFAENLDLDEIPEFVRNIPPEDIEKLGLILMDLGYIGLEIATAKYTMKKNLPQGTSMNVKRMAEELLESTTELKEKSGES